MQQLDLIHESIYDALRHAVEASGGYKRVGAALWPAKAVEAAAANLRACLDPERREQISLDELVLLLRLARKGGCHAAMAWLATEAGYAAPSPVSPAVARAEALAEFDTLSRRMQQIMTRLERVGE